MLFTPSEILDDLIEEGFRPLRVVASGTLARLLPPRTLKKIVNNPSLYKEFLEFSRSMMLCLKYWSGSKSSFRTFSVGRRRNSNEEMV